MDIPPSLWIVLDSEGRPEFAAGWREAAHEHIKDAIEIEVDETASRWVVREYVPAAELTRLRAENAALRGVTPELPPRAPDGGGLPRYGLRHNGSAMPMSVPMDDGYWTPYHLAIAEVDALKSERQELNCAVLAAKSESAEFVEIYANEQADLDALLAALRGE